MGRAGHQRPAQLLPAHPPGNPAFRYNDSFCQAHGLQGYERLILDAMLCGQSLFTRSDGIEHIWEASTPLLDNPPPLQPYAPGSWGYRPSANSSRHTSGICQAPAKTPSGSWPRPTLKVCEAGSSIVGTAKGGRRHIPSHDEEGVPGRGPPKNE
ncbi:hypothetical protein [Streptomyces sp. NPDC094472]|uniref:hypothetical protein n=1 Tax=Streptomyces sp. NPDC094472 TaxID=3155080 RepID=UPI00332BF93C